MPLIQKTCILCGSWIKRSRRKRNSLCLRCIEKVNRKFKKSVEERRRNGEPPRSED